MSVTFYIHLEPVERDVVWWAETDAVPGLSVAASTLRELRTLIDEAVRRHLGHEAEASLELVADEAQAAADRDLAELSGVDLPAGGTSSSPNTLVRLGTAA